MKNNTMKRYIIQGLVFLLFCLALGCKPKGNKEMAGTLVAEKALLPAPESIEVDTIKSYTVTCNCGDSSKLVVETRYRTVHDSVSHHRVLVVKQELRFIEREEVVNLSLPFFDSVMYFNKNSMLAKQTALRKVKCISSGGSHIYSLYGAHWFDPPHEFFGLCSTRGKWLWYYYGSMHEVFKKYGDDEKYEREFGSEVRSLKNMIPVLPAGT